MVLVIKNLASLTYAFDYLVIVMATFGVEPFITAYIYTSIIYAMSPNWTYKTVHDYLC